jgi:hypothetical protein
MSAPGEVVCGFGDEATGLAGVGWSLGGSAGGLLSANGTSSAAEASIEQNGDGLRLVLRTEGTSVEVDLSPAAPAASLPGADGGDPSAAVCTALARPSEGGGVECAGQATHWESDPAGGAGTFRHLAIPAPEGGLILVISTGPGSDHASETTGAWLLDGTGRASAFAEALLSTQYDGAGLPARAGLELWPAADDDAHLTRAAGTAVGAASEQGAVSAALMRTSAEGCAGLGSYLLRRA